ncbi:serine/threonine protein kinase [Microtetraspora malaysiensis]|uniref:serine/threonine protein kinase n=1 Tax=Microtetraspora malaysiensis TaxID=161358 RepID=UPI003D89E8F5
MPEWMALLPSDLEAVGPYRLEGRLGVGGQGTVYVGSAVPGQRVAVKLLHPHLAIDKMARARFLSEVEIAKRVALFCTAKVLDSGFVNERPYIVSEFVDGPSLQESVLNTGPRSEAALERLALNTATALAAIHQADVVHRDFKPGNVLLGPDGPVVIDFGIARALDISRSVTTSQVVGSPGYMAPEQLAGGKIAPAVDLFAWGATIVFAATGKRAFSGDSIPAIIRSILHDQPNLDGLDGRLGAIVRACLAKDPARRPTAAEVVDGLRGLPSSAWRTGNSVVSEPANGAGRRDGKDRAPAENGKRRHFVLIGAAVLPLLAALGITYSVVTLGQGAEDFTASKALPSTSPSGGGSPASPSPADATAGRTTSPSARPRKSPKADKTERQNPRRSDDARNSGGTKPSASQTPTQKPTQKPSSPAKEQPQPSADRPQPDAGRRSPSSGQEQPSSNGREPTPSGPRVLGTVSQSDVNAYCQSQGYFGGVGGAGNYSCYGTSGRREVTMTNICQWAYPGYPNVRTEGDTCMSS